MSLTIKYGLFKYDLTDHHAVLGLPVTADANTVRKRYLKLARLLHPDTVKVNSDAERQQASELLSKLINPAYETLKGKTHHEHQIVLEQTGKRLASEGNPPNVQSEMAKNLLKAGGNVDLAYAQALKALTDNQYKSIAACEQTIGELSELNLVYLMLKAGQGLRQAPPTPKAAPSATPSAQKAKPPVVPEESSPVLAYVRRAQEYITKNNFAKAVLELRDGLKLDPKNSTCHGLLGMAYLKQNQVSMAKVHILKSLQSNPEEAIALQCKAVIEKKLGQPLTAHSAGSNSSGGINAKNKAAQDAKQKAKGKSDPKADGGGMFG
ncbi:MAG: molecular chaperone DnaJ, partial [Spirulina sp. DLM2.Bin59]